MSDSENSFGTTTASALGAVTTGDQGREVAEPIFLKVGAFLFQVESLKQASQMFCAARDAAGEGASKTPTCNIVTADHREVARISYNGRVWPAGEWKLDSTPLYDNAAAA